MKIYLDSIGCRLNQSEIESMARQFRAAGHEILPSAQGADMAVINTCAVTAEAAADSRRCIRGAARAGAGEIVVTGCWATLRPEEAAGLPQVRRVVRNEHKDHLVSDVLDLSPPIFDLEPLARAPLPGLRHRTRAFIKVQDGCDNRCTFCITAIARGAGRSRAPASVIADVRAALAGGAKEVVLSGVHLGSWGREFGSHLRALIRAILQETEVPRLRLSSLEPWDLDAEFFSLWENPRLMPHLHLPLQSGCAATLRRMARKTTPDAFRSLVGAARRLIPEVAITTDLIAGFPGETEEEFAASLAFVREMHFAGGHVFTFSPRPGTPAARMKGPIPLPVRKERNRILRQALLDSACSYRQQFIGRKLSVLWESASGVSEHGWRMEGLTENYLRVTAWTPAPRWNQIDEVELLELSRDGLRGRIWKAGCAEAHRTD